MKGRLKERLDFWKEIGACNWVLKILSQGYALPFTSEPEPAIFRNHLSALDNANFVTKGILDKRSLDLLDSGRVREIDFSEVHTLHPLSVVDNGEKLRLILDLRRINKFLQVPMFKCSSTEPEILSFSWITEVRLRYFVFTVLVFGLFSAPYVFTRILKVLIKHWRSLGMRNLAFIDDSFGGGRSFDGARKLGGIVKSDLFRSGFVAHPIKSQWVPKQEGEHLGFIANLKEGTFAVPQRRITALRHKLAYFQTSSNTTARKLASLGLVLGPLVRMWNLQSH